MPKIKTCKSAAKRFKKTASGKFLRGRAYKRHILDKKTSKRKRELSGCIVVDKTNANTLKKLLPYL